MDIDWGNMEVIGEKKYGNDVVLIVSVDGKDRAVYGDLVFSVTHNMREDDYGSCVVMIIGNTDNVAKVINMTASIVDTVIEEYGVISMFRSFAAVIFHRIVGRFTKGMDAQ